MVRKKGDAGAKPNNFTEINKLIAKFLEDVAKDFSDYSDGIHPNEPITYRFNLEINPKIAENAPTEQAQRDFLVDTIDRSESITVIAELPGAKRNKIKVHSASNEIIIHDNSKTHPSRRINLPGNVDPDSGVAKFRNGILEVTFIKASYSNKRAVLRVTD